jgi:hypothetical protein
VIVPSDNIAVIVSNVTSLGEAVIPSDDATLFLERDSMSSLSSVQNRRTNNTMHSTPLNSLAANSTELAPATENAEESSSDTDDDTIRIHNQDWPADDLGNLPVATMLEDPDELIYEATEVYEEQLPCFKEHKGQLFILIFILGFVSASLAVTFIWRRSPNSRSGVGNTLSPSLKAPSSVPSMQPSSCDTYRLVYRGALFEDTREFYYPYVAIDGDDAVVGKLLSGDLLFVSNVLEVQSQSVANVTLDARSTQSVAISGNFAVVGARDAYSSQATGTVHVVEKDFQGTWKQTFEISYATAAPHTVDIDEDVIVVFAGGHDRVDSWIDIYRHVNTTWVKEAQIFGSDLGYEWGSESRAVSVKGDFVALGSNYHDGANRAVTMYKFDSLSKSWNQFNDPITNDDCDYAFGSRVVLLEENELLMSCSGESKQSGVVYFYSRSDTGQYKFQQKVVVSDDALEDASADPDTLAADENIMLLVSSNIIYLFTKKNTTWTEVHKIPALDEALGHFGLSVSISGRIALISSEHNVHSYFLEDC